MTTAAEPATAARQQARGSGQIQTSSHAGGITSALILARISGSVTGAERPR